MSNSSRLLALLLLFAAAALAEPGPQAPQVAADPGPRQEGAAAPADETPGEIATDEATASEAVPTRAKEPRTRVFRPSEEISVDNSVPYPVDI